MQAPILETHNLTKQYAGHRALHDVSISIPSGSIYGLLGPNGAGKTSLIRIITQITAPDSGTIYFKGKKLDSEHTQRIGYLPEERGLYKKMELGEQLLFFARLKGLSRQQALAIIKPWIERLELGAWWKKKIEDLSKGMQQKVQFIATVLHQPELIILDEPFSGFDPINAGLITEELLQLRAKGCTIIFSTHRMETVEQLCDHICLIHQSKKVLEGPIETIRNQYRQQTYRLVHHTPLLPHQAYHILSTHPKSGLWETIIKPNEEMTSTELMRLLLNENRITAFEEQIPEMHQVFISAVNQAHISHS